MFELRMSLQSLMVALALVLIFVGPGLGMAAPLGEPDDEAFDMENYDLNSETDWENLDINIYGDSYDYDDLDQEVRELRDKAHITSRSTQLKTLTVKNSKITMSMS